MYVYKCTRLGIESRRKGGGGGGGSGKAITFCVGFNITACSHAPMQGQLGKAKNTCSVYSTILPYIDDCTVDILNLI